ncbi:MAG: SRPBCC domain-containing protein [Planctomycetota bacterium]
MKITPAQIASVTVETTIHASPEQVWLNLTDNIGRWWPNEFYTGGSAGHRSYTLEAKPGGRMIEEWSDGGGILWGTVQTVAPGKKLEVSGMITPQWGGPAFWTGTWSLEEEAGSTRVSFTDSTVGNIAEDNMGGKAKGWEFLFCQALKAHCEGEPAPAWSE